MKDLTGKYSTAANNPMDLMELPDKTLVSVYVDVLKYPLEHLMKLVALRGFSCFVKCDAARTQNIFTVMVGNYPRIDTDNPKQYLMEILGIKNENEEE
ncbi:MAG: hypothetical protein ACP5D6_10465 [Kosmotogaceae bacterium]